MTPRIAIRVDGSAKIGTGHVRRCLSLAESLRDFGAEILFVIRDLGGDACQFVRDAGHHCIELTRPIGDWRPAEGEPAHADWAEIDWADDARDCAAALADWAPHWLLVDCYAFDRRWHEAVRTALSSHIAAIDDLGDRLMAVDLLVDHNPSTDHKAKYSHSSCFIGKILGRPRFALLGTVYQNRLPCAVANEVRSIGIFMGGVDADSWSELALAACRTEAGFCGSIAIASTSANPNLARLKAVVSADPAATLILDQTDLADFFASHDLQIGAGGGASWERCVVGVPSIILKTADNQQVVLDGLAAANAAICLATPDRVSLGAAVQQLCTDADERRAIAANARAMVDGKGCKRIAAVMLAETFHIRPATLEDGERMHCWRNDPRTRAVSRDGDPIELADHMAWLAKSLASADRCILIGCTGLVPIGVIRFDRLGFDRFEVSIYLDPDMTGLGFGQLLLARGEEWLANQQLGAIDIIAETLPGNFGSQSMFQRGGYHEHDGPDRFIKRLSGPLVKEADSGYSAKV